MKKLYDFCRGEFAAWHWFEVLWMFFATISITVIAVILGDTALGISSAVAGTMYTMLAGKGKLSCYFFGIYNTIAYGLIAKGQTLFGDMMLNWFVYLPMMIAGIVMWRKKLDDGSCVIKASLRASERVFWIFALLLALAVYSFILAKLGDKQPVIDGATTVLSVAAMILTLKRCIEQWLLWTTVNALSIVMWARVYFSDGGSVATLLWWMIMLISGIIFFIQWYRDLKLTSSSSAGSSAEKCSGAF